VTGAGRAGPAALLRAEIDAVLADWAYYLDHRELDELAALFTDDAVFITGGLEFHGRAEIKNRYLERSVVRTTRHTYSGLRVTAIGGAPDRLAGAELTGAGLTGTGLTGTGLGGAGLGGAGQQSRPARVRAQSTWVNYAANAPAPLDDVGVYLVADFDDVLTWCPDQRWRISERHIIPVFRDPSRAPA
jgi:hypothetical protein